jgi:5-methylcytosine-specific restriction endonuclease McrA
MSLNSELVKRECPNCGSAYQARLGRLKFGRETTCSRACSYALRGNQKVKVVDMVCDVCGGKFNRCPAKVKGKSNSVCSLECYFQGRKSRLFDVIPRPPQKPLIRFKCEICKTDVELPASRKGSRRYRFCSASCANAGNSGADNYFWRGGHLKYYGETWPSARRAARKRDNYTCRRCFKVMTPPHRAPDVHHIKPFKTFTRSEDANVIDNLISLCHRCHVSVEWNGIDFALQQVNAVRFERW